MIGEDFKTCLIEMKEASEAANIDNPIFIWIMLESIIIGDHKRPLKNSIFFFFFFRPFPSIRGSYSVSSFSKPSCFQRPSPLHQLPWSQFSILHPRNSNLYIFNLSKIQIFFLLKKFSLSSLQFNPIYFLVHLQINHIYFSVHLQMQCKKQIGLLIILKSH